MGLKSQESVTLPSSPRTDPMSKPVLDPGPIQAGILEAWLVTSVLCTQYGQSCPS